MIHVSSARRLTRVRSPAAILALVYTLTSALYYSRFLAHTGREISGGPDGVLYAWFFESVRQTMLHGHNPLFTDYVNAPGGMNLMWNTAILALAILCIPVTVLIGAPSTIVILMVLSPAISATCAYLAVSRLVANRAAAAIAALLYGFGPYFVGQNGHLHLALAFLPPLLLLVGHRLLLHPERATWRRDGLWLGGLVAVGLLCGEEIVAMTAVAAVVAVVVLTALCPHQVRSAAPAAFKATALGAVVAGAITAYPLWFQFFGPHSLWHGPQTEIGQNLASLVRPSDLQFFASSADVAANRRYSSYGLENTGYLGWPLVILVLGAVGYGLLRRDRFQLWWSVSALILIVLSCGPELRLGAYDLGAGPWRPLVSLPVVSSVVPVRLSLLTLLLVACGVARALSAVGQSVRTTRWRAVLVVATALVLLGPVLPHGRYHTAYLVHTPRFFTTASAVASIPRGSTVLLLPYGSDPGSAGHSMMWQLQSHLRFKIVGGYGVFEIGGRSSYRAEQPAYAAVLGEVGRTGVRPDGETLVSARRALVAAPVAFLVLTRGQSHAELVRQVGAQLAGCAWRPVSDVEICAVAR